MLQTAAKPEEIGRAFFSQTKALKMRVRGRHCNFHGKITVGDSLGWDSAHHVKTVLHHGWKSDKTTNQCH